MNQGAETLPASAYRLRWLKLKINRAKSTLGRDLTLKKIWVLKIEPTAP
jgi:hypothetical protein